MLIAGAANMMGGVAGSQAAAAGNKNAERIRQQMLAIFQGIDVPTIQEQELQLQNPEYLQNLVNQTESAQTLGPSEMEGVSTDPRLEQAQMAALEQLSELGQTGLSPAEAAALRSSRRGAASEAEAKSSQIMQEMARRGMGGSGMELAQRLQAAQSGADRQSREGDDVMKMAQERALQAISQGSGLASNVRGQEFGEKSSIAKAQDAINQFNTQNQQNVSQRNIQSANQANQRNIAEQQRIAEAKNANQNQQQTYNKGLLQTNFQNQITKAGGMAGQMGGMANAAQQAGANQGQMLANIGSSVGGIASAYGNKKDSDDSWAEELDN